MVQLEAEIQARNICKSQNKSKYTLVVQRIV